MGLPGRKNKTVKRQSQRQSFQQQHRKTTASNDCPDHYKQVCRSRRLKPASRSNQRVPKDAVDESHRHDSVTRRCSSCCCLVQQQEQLLNKDAAPWEATDYVAPRSGAQKRQSGAAALPGVATIAKTTQCNMATLLNTAKRLAAQAACGPRVTWPHHGWRPPPPAAAAPHRAHQGRGRQAQCQWRRCPWQDSNRRHHHWAHLRFRLLGAAKAQQHPAHLRLRLRLGAAKTQQHPAYLRLRQSAAVSWQLSRLQVQFPAPETAQQKQMQIPALEQPIDLIPALVAVT